LRVMNAVHSGRDEKSVQPAFQANGQPQIAVVEKHWNTTS